MILLLEATISIFVNKLTLLTRKAIILSVKQLLTANAGVQLKKRSHCSLSSYSGMLTHIFTVAPAAIFSDKVITKIKPGKLKLF